MPTRKASATCQIRSAPGLMQFRDELVGRLRDPLRQMRFESHGADFKAAQGLLQRFLEIAADGHDLAHGLHLRGQARIGSVELLEGETRHLGDHVVDRRLEGGRRGAAGDIVASSSSV
jgi:hypothetical protein